MIPVSWISPYTSLIGFLIGLPTAIATYYQAFKNTAGSAPGSRWNAAIAAIVLSSLNAMAAASTWCRWKRCTACQNLAMSSCCRETASVAIADFNPAPIFIDRIEHIYTPANIKKSQPPRGAIDKDGCDRDGVELKRRLRLGRPRRLGTGGHERTGTNGRGYNRSRRF